MRNGTSFRLTAALALAGTALSPVAAGAAESARPPAPVVSTASGVSGASGPFYFDDDFGQKKKKKGNTGKIIACGAMILLGALLGGKKGLAIGVGACAVTWAIAGLTKKDNDALTDRTTELMDADSPQHVAWTAPESGKQLQVTTGQPEAVEARMEFEVDDGVAAPQQGTRLATEPYVVVVDRLNFRTEPSAASPNSIRGYFERGEIVQVIGISPDGQWAAVGDDGVVVGYASLTAGGADALVTVNRANQLRRPAPAPAVKKGRKPVPQAQPQRLVVNKATPRAKPKIVMTASSTTGVLRNADTMKTKTTKVANVTTYCKSVQVSDGTRNVADKKGCQKANGSYGMT